MGSGKHSLLGLSVLIHTPQPHTPKTWLQENGYNPESIYMRRKPNNKDPKGSCFVQLDTVEAAKKLVESKLQYNGKEMVIELKPAYHERKRASRKAQTQKKKAQEQE